MNQHRILALTLAALTVGGLSARAQTAPPPATPASPAPATPAAAAAAPAAPAGPSAMTTPSMSGPLTANGNPYKLDTGPLGSWYITGALTGLAFTQNAVVPGDNTSHADIDNAQVFVQKTDGIVQFFVQAGWYSLPDLGAPYVDSGHAWDDYYGPVPQAFLKIVPNSTWSFEIGKLPTLVGDEYTFSYENMNIERGLLWNQEPAVSRGVQLNYSKGPVSASVSWNDGFYSNHYSSFSGSLAWTISSADTLTFVGEGDAKTVTVSTLATPIDQDNEDIFNVIYTHTSGPWTFSPYVQFTSVASNPAIGAYQSGTTTGFAVLLNYTFDAKSALAGFSLPMRAEYITSTGSPSQGAPNLLGYGAGSTAWSYTITPTYQYKIFFARAEASYVGATNMVIGEGFGTHGTDQSQERLMVEAGILF